MTDPDLDASHQVFETSFTDRLPGRDASAFALVTYALGAGRRAEALIGEVVRPYGLDSTQYSVLVVLWMTGPPHRVSPTRLSRTLAQSPSGMTHTVKRLTTAGLVQRVGDATDGRSSHVELTAEGVRVARACVTAVAAEAEAAFGGTGVPLPALTDAQRAVVARLEQHQAG